MFIVSTLVLLSILATKINFLLASKGVPGSLLEYLSLSFLILTILFGIYLFFKSNKKAKREVRQKPNSMQILLLLIISVFVLGSFVINFGKKAVLWDAAALYDARARYLGAGVKFAQMIDLSKYDPANSYYYLLYPPYTSIVHSFWNSVTTIPVGIYYSINLLLLSIVVYTFTKKRLSRTFTLLLVILVASNDVVLLSSLAEYTNLPFTLSILTGLFLLYEFLEYKVSWKYFYGIGLISTSIWIRQLEPLWFGIFLAFAFALFYKEKSYKKFILPLIAFIYGVIEYLSWQTFVLGFGSKTSIVGFSLLHLVEPVVGAFTGSFLYILGFFVKSWGLIFAVHIFAIYIGLSVKKLRFLGICLLLCMSIYFAGLYFVSFQSDWWDKLGDSLTRSSTFMIPISGYIILRYINFKNAK